MKGYEETMELLSSMKAHFDDGFTSSERSTIEYLYSLVCTKHVRRNGCGDCYRDAYIEIYTKLKRLGKMVKTPNYVLKAGALIHPFGTSEFYTLNNIPDDVAEKYLGQYPAQISLFEKYPSDWRERAAKAVSPVEEKSEDAKEEKKEDDVATETAKRKYERKTAKEGSTLKPLKTKAEEE